MNTAPIATDEDVEQQIMALLRSQPTLDFALKISRVHGRWSVAREELREAGTQLGEGASLAEAWSMQQNASAHGD